VVEINVKNKNTYSGEGEFIGRPSPLENPFRISETQSRDVSIHRFAFYLLEILSNEGHCAYLHDEITFELTRLFSILIDNQKLNLICYCYPKLCHGNVIKQVLLNKYHCGTWLIDGKIGIYGV
jgi:hypothetical protein